MMAEVLGRDLAVSGCLIGGWMLMRTLLGGGRTDLILNGGIGRDGGLTSMSGRGSSRCVDT